MRSSIVFSSFIALAASQSLDFNQVAAAKSAVVTAAPVTGTQQSVSAQPSTAASSVGSAAVQSSPIAQRDLFELEKRDGNCAAQPAGTGPAVRYPNDSPSSFENYPYFKAAAYSAQVPQGYSLNFTNLNASTSTSSYMGYTNLNSYNTTQCAALCTAATGCQAFNLYFERDPTVDPNAQSCPNPPSLTNIKCVFWGVPISAVTATNYGQFRDSFQVVIAGSNGYNVLPAPPSNPGWTLPIPFPGLPNCPFDPFGNYSTYIGSKYFSFGIGPGQIQYYNVGVCTAACAAQTAYNFAHPPTDGSKPQICNHVVGSVLNNAFGIPEGVYCAMYTESWDPIFGTTKQASFQGAQWTVGYSVAYTNATYAANYAAIKPNGYQGGNCGGWGVGTC